MVRLQPLNLDACGGGNRRMEALRGGDDAGVRVVVVVRPVIDDAEGGGRAEEVA